MGNASIWIDAGMLAVSVVAAVAAWFQAIAARKGKRDAEAARDKARDAQKEAAGALVEANRIAGEARDLLREQDNRDRERHRVAWRDGWDREAGKWFLANDGPDSALEVRLVATVSNRAEPYTQKCDEVAPRKGLTIDLPDYKPGEVPRVEWSVEWRTPHGMNHEGHGGYLPLL